MSTLASKGIYNGGKNGDGVYQLIINQIPPHKIWIEACAGSAAITKNICPAAQSFVFEVEPVQASKLKIELNNRAVIFNSNFMDGSIDRLSCGEATFIYIDPPYMKSTRLGKRNIYKEEWTDNDHEKFLWWLTERREMIMVNHPICHAYMCTLGDWRRVEYKYMSRGGLLDDCLWMNYRTQDRLHDYSYVGSDRTERQRIKRKADRVIAKLSALPGIERNAIIERIRKEFG